jgi:hypothetical protein
MKNSSLYATLLAICGHPVKEKVAATLMSNGKEEP